MAATTPNGAEASTTEGDLMVKPPENVVIPPKGVREDIHKTTDFIFRKGDPMLDGMRERSRNNPKFSFLFEADPYFSYFAWHLQQLREGKGTTASGGRAAVPQKPKGPPKPPDFRFSARMPTISALDLEILKATALWTAKNGENWLKELRNREGNNFQFDFLRPNHSYHQYFRNIVDQYRLLLEDERSVKDRIDELRRNIENRFNVLDKAKSRAEYVRYTSAQKEKEDKRIEDEKKEYAQIDWNDFVVIATVTFDEADDAAELPPPTSLNDLQSASLEMKAKMSLSNRRIEEAAPDEQTYYNISQQAPPVQPPVQPYMPAPPPPQPMYAPPPPVGYAPARDEEDERYAREQQLEREKAAQAQAAAKNAPSNMNIREGYRRENKKKGPVAMLLCPNCKQQVPADELDAHMKIELLDPRWKEQREKSDARYASTNLNTVDVANNLKRFASMRADIYDDATGMPITEEEAARRKKAALSYDGQPDPAKDALRLQEMQSLNVQDQLRRIQEKHGGK
ncbi:Pre-mRNA splicing factor PRP21 like protein-domain-containing protein [Lophiotrema nucula]|uniref:Pre-mRNA splicing factor PRP21 like protein-domain-containing protein n=1 Tax=Lophiotrema nucula TaxID=690887 RepID=A0A6A5YU81_9PLEO|nr:Pre-mRNA splicing factor PRP21 like protein-domain-containing protein [Lophiotrema nucula]